MSRSSSATSPNSQSPASVSVNPHATERGISVRRCGDECEFLYRDISTGRVRVFSCLDAAIDARDADVRYQRTLSAAFPSQKRRAHGPPAPANRPRAVRKKLRRTGSWDLDEEQRLMDLVDQLRPAGRHPIDFLWISRHVITRDREQCRHRMARLIADGRMPAFKFKARYAVHSALSLTSKTKSDDADDADSDDDFQSSDPPTQPREIVKKTSRPRRIAVDPMQRRRAQEDAMHAAPTKAAPAKPKRASTRMLMEEFGAAVVDPDAVFLDDAAPSLTPPPALSDLLGDETIASFFVDEDPPQQPAQQPAPQQPSTPETPVRVEAPLRSKTVAAKPGKEPGKEPGKRRVATAIPRTVARTAPRGLANAVRPIVKKTATGFRVCMGARAPNAVPGVAMQARLTRDPSHPDYARPMFATSVRYGGGWDPFAFGNNTGFSFKFVTTKQPERPRDALRLRAQELMYRVVSRGAPTLPSGPLPVPTPPPSAPTSSGTTSSATPSATGCTR